MFEMEDLPMKPAPVKRKSTVGKRPPDLSKPIPPKRLSQKKRELMSKPLSPVQKRSQSAKVTTTRPKKSLPPMRTPGEQPRDSFGRFASKAGKALWSGTKTVAKGTGKAVSGTAKTVKSAHRAIKRSNAAARRRASLADRERALALRERAAKLQGKSRRKAGKGKGTQRKQGFLSKLFFGRKKRK